MSTHYLCFEQKYEKYLNFYLKLSFFLVVKFSIYLNTRVFVMDVISESESIPLQNKQDTVFSEGVKLISDIFKKNKTKYSQSESVYFRYLRIRHGFTKQVKSLTSGI